MLVFFPQTSCCVGGLIPPSPSSYFPLPSPPLVFFLNVIYLLSFPLLSLSGMLVGTSDYTLQS